MSIFEQITDSKSLKEQVYSRIKEAIIKGDLLPGAPLIEVEIAREMNISRAPIREALNILEQDGFVVSIPRKGCNVSTISEKEIRESFEARLLMEPYAIRKTIDSIPIEDIERVENQVIRLLEIPTDFELYIKADQELHALMHKYLANEYIRSMMLRVDTLSMRMRYSETYKEFNVDYVKAISQEHLAIIEGLKNKDIDQAVMAIEKHIVNGQERTLRPLIG